MIPFAVGAKSLPAVAKSFTELNCSFPIVALETNSGCQIV